MAGRWSFPLRNKTSAVTGGRRCGCGMFLREDRQCQLAEFIPSKDVIVA